VAVLVTLTTDFGSRDPFVGIMKGVILGICPGAQLVDITHEVAPHDILEAALALESSVRFFPESTVHLAVVDPGVGSARRALAVRTRGQYFVGPDNGIFTSALALDGWVAVSLEAPAYRLPVVSSTFHGRDIFAPAAAHLAAGVALERLGRPVADPVRLPWPGCWKLGQQLVGEVIGSDRFGNLVTSIGGDDIRALGPSSLVLVVLANRAVGSIVSCYEEGLEGRASAIIGSTGRLEIFVRNGSARALLDLGRGAPVRLAASGLGDEGDLSAERAGG